MFLFTDRAGRFSLLKTSCLLLLVAPALWLSWRALNHDLGPRAMTEALHVTGQWAVRFLLAALALTPLQRLFRWNRLALIRRMLGVGACAWAVGHLVLYVASVKYDIGFAVSEIFSRYYLTIGFAAVLGLAMLAATSTDRMVSRLGPWWKRIHRAVYAIAALAILHFFMQSKLDASEATLMAGLFLTLMIYRLAMRPGRSMGPAMLAGVAAAGAASTALAEFAWYDLATGANPWRVLQANLHPEQGLRPAVLVLLSAVLLGLAVIVHQRRSPGRGNTGRSGKGGMAMPTGA
jgi:sulfoxide reductase heme-binding subunit YedZ